MEKKQYDLDFESSGGDAGVIYTMRCEDCGDKINVAEYQWWDTKCSCGYRWSLVVKAVGTKSTAP